MMPCLARQGDLKMGSLVDRLNLFLSWKLGFRVCYCHYGLLRVLGRESVVVLQESSIIFLSKPLFSFGCRKELSKCHSRVHVEVYNYIRPSVYHTSIVILQMLSSHDRGPNIQAKDKGILSNYFVWESPESHCEVSPYGRWWVELSGITREYSEVRGL